LGQSTTGSSLAFCEHTCLKKNKVFERKKMRQEQYTNLKDDCCGENQNHCIQLHFTARQNEAVVNVLVGAVYILAATQEADRATYVDFCSQCIF
jgi:hypothetical protein